MKPTYFSPRPGTVVCTKEEDDSSKTESSDCKDTCILSAKSCSWTWSPLSPNSTGTTESRDIAARANSLDSVGGPALHAGIRGISVELKSRDLLAVVGEIGSGKTSFLCALLGELHLNAGNLRWKGNDKPKTIYVPQMPYVVNAPLWENITFGSMEW